MIQKALQILQENQQGLIWRDDEKKYIPFDIIEFEIDEDYENFILYDVRYDMGRNAYVDLNLYENNLKATILNILNDNGINAKIKRMGFITIKEEDTMENVIEFKAVKGEDKICGYMYLEDADDEAPLHFYDENGVEVGTHLPYSESELYEAFTTDSQLVQYLVDFATENRTFEREGYTLHINEGAKMETQYERVSKEEDAGEYEAFFGKIKFVFNGENILEILDEPELLADALNQYWDNIPTHNWEIRDGCFVFEFPKSVWGDQDAEDIIEEYRNVAMDYLARQFTSDLGVYARYGEMMEQDIETNFADDDGLQTLYHFVETGDGEGFHKFLIDKGYEVEDGDIDAEGIEVTIPNAEEVLEKIVKASGNTGRVYLPVAWVGRKVKIILLK